MIQNVDDLQERIDELLERRGRIAAKVDARALALGEVNSDVARLAESITSLPEAILQDEAVRAAASRIHSFQSRSELRNGIDGLRATLGRLGRETINVGVSGQARTGKSTLLQAISGLGDDQIPTGRGLPVTAVRSRIFHDPTSRRAIIRLHSEHSFLHEVVRPYCAPLDVAAPGSIDEFTRMPIPSNEQLEAAKAAQSNATMANRLRDMQTSLPAYRAQLSGSEQIISLDLLRPWVSYPTLDEQQAGTPDRLYLAVRDVRIETDFPHASVQGLGLIDLPGLGEVAADADEHHLNGLRHDVDFVLMLKRPDSSQTSYWKTEDAAAVAVLDKARGDVERRRDFVGIVVNRGKSDSQDLLDALEHSLREDANGGTQNTYFYVHRTDATDPQSVQDHLMLPVLKHLAERLPEMDAQVVRAALTRVNGALDSLSGDAESLWNAVAAATSVQGTARREVDRRAREMRLDISAGLNELRDKLWVEARDPQVVDPGFVTSVQDAAEHAHLWVDGGFDQAHREAWIESCARQMRAEGGSLTVIERELNAVRVGIARRFMHVSDYINDIRIKGVLSAVVDILQQQLGSLIDDHDRAAPAEYLDFLATQLRGAADPCVALAGALEDLSTLQLEFRTLVYPRVRDEAEVLQAQTRDENGVLSTQVPLVEPTQAGAEKLLRWLQQKAHQVIYETEKQLVGGADSVAAVLHAAVELFEDGFIRAKDIEEEYRSLCHSYRDEIWPSDFDGIDSNNAKIEALHRTVEQLQKSAATLARQDVFA